MITDSIKSRKLRNILYMVVFMLVSGMAEAKGTRLYVGNLAFQTTEDTLLQKFSEFGEVAEVKLILDRETGRSRGFAFVVLKGSDAARKAVEQMNGAIVDGRALRVNEDEDRDPRHPGGSLSRNNSRGNTQ